MASLSRGTAAFSGAKAWADRSTGHRLSHLSPTQRRALMLADNRIAENAGWDDEMLAAELTAFRDENVDLGMLGFDDDDLDRLLAEAGGEAEDADEAPALPEEPVSRPGDLWICGEHRVLCGDATVLADVETVLGGELADMCFTDPPYNVNYGNPRRTSAWARTPHPQRCARRGVRSAALRRRVNILTMTKGAIYICMSLSELDVLQKAFREAAASGQPS